jgi:hypothetical protein
MAGPGARTNLISLVLFGAQDRYWNCLPGALIFHAGLYPDFRLRLHISRDVVSHRLFPFLREFARRLGRIDLVLVDRDYVGTEPTTWRMMPLWDPTVALMLSRDLDGAPRREELKAVRVFRRDDSTLIHGIRSYRLHNILLLAGLCGFKSPELGFFRKDIGSFSHYRAIYQRLGLNGQYGCDQWMLKAAFTRHADRILDSRFGDAPPLDEPVATQSPDVYDAVDLDAQALEDTRPALQAMLELDTPVVRIFRQVLGEFPEAASHYLRR